MGKPNLSDEFKRDAVAQITKRGYPVAEVWLRRPSVRSGSASASTHCIRGSGCWRGKCRAMAGTGPGDRGARHSKKPPRISLEMQSEMRVHCRASRSFRRAGNVSVPRCTAEWLLCLAEEPAEPEGSGRCSANGVDPARLERQRQGLWLPQAAR